MNAPVVRRKLLREVSRDSPRLVFKPPKRLVRRSVGRLLGFEPLHSLSKSERTALREKMAHEINQDVDRQFDNARKLITGKMKLRRYGKNRMFPRGRPLKMTPERLTKLFSSGSAVSAHLATEHEGEGRSSYTLGGYGARGAKGYAMESLGFNPVDLARKAVRRKKGPIRLLDVGSQDSRALFDIKKALGKKVETHALSPTDVPRFPSDAYHFLAAEHLPTEFREKFDLIISNRALEYSIFPHLAIQNIALALAPQGRAFLQWRTNTGLSERAKKALRESPFGKPTVEGVRVVYDLNAMHAGRKKRFSAKEREKYSKQSVQKMVGLWPEAIGESVQHMAVLNVLAQLRKSKKFRLRFHSTSQGAFGTMPHVFEIRRI